MPLFVSVDTSFLCNCTLNQRWVVIKSKQVIFQYISKSIYIRITSSVIVCFSYLQVPLAPFFGGFVYVHTYPICLPPQQEYVVKKEGSKAPENCKKKVKGKERKGWDSLRRRR